MVRHGVSRFDVVAVDLDTPEHASGTAPAEAATETRAGRPTSSQHNMFRSSSIGGYLGPPAPLPQRTFDPPFSGAYTSDIMQQVVLQGSHDP